MIGVLWLGVTVSVASTYRIHPAKRSEMGVMLSEKWIPRNSLVREAVGSCSTEERAVTVLEVNPWYRIPKVALTQKGDTLCVPQAALSDNPQSVQKPAVEQKIRNVFQERFGAIEDQKIISTPWGTVALPMMHELTQEEREQEYQREHLRTPQQRQRATDAVGPSRHGQPIYTHFLGSDAPRSDRWGSPDLVMTLLAVFDQWAQHCRDTLPASIPSARPETCVVQVGDLAWYNDTRPDPLGHTSHFDGKCVDIRLFRNDGSRYEAWWNRADDRPEAVGGYSRSLTQAFLEFVTTRFEPSVVYFNDPRVIESVVGVLPFRGHDDHIHLCF